VFIAANRSASASLNFAVTHDELLNVLAQVHGLAVLAARHLLDDTPLETALAATLDVHWRGLRRDQP
jgi:hypothetical protein